MHKNIVFGPPHPGFYKGPTVRGHGEEMKTEVEEKIMKEGATE